MSEQQKASHLNEVAHTAITKITGAEESSDETQHGHFACQLILRMPVLTFQSQVVYLKAYGRMPMSY